MTADLDQARRWWIWGLAFVAATWIIGIVNPGITRDIFRFPHSIDWDVYVEAAKRLGTDQLYVWPGGYDWCEHCMFRYSPIFAWLVGFMAPIGVVGMRLVHVAVLPLMGWRMAVVALLSWPFWQDLQTGNIVTFAVVAGVLAIRGNPWGIGAYLAIAMLAPRPFLLPLFIWLLWKNPDWRLPATLAILLHLLVVATLGYVDDWISIVLRANLDFGASYDYGPARLIGSWWLAVGTPLALWLTWKGRVGLASLAIQPYWLGYYLLVGMLDLSRPRATLPSSGKGSANVKHPGELGGPKSTGRVPHAEDALETSSPASSMVDAVPLLGDES